MVAHEVTLCVSYHVLIEHKNVPRLPQESAYCNNLYYNGLFKRPLIKACYDNSY